MALGDILSFVIDTSGWKATVKVEGLGTGGTYDFGLGTNNDPTSASIELSLTSQGYTDGILGTTSRTVYGVPCVYPDLGAMRKAYPNDANPNETISGSDVDIVIALSEPIYDDDTSITVDILSDWYTEGGTGSNSKTALSVTSNSTLDYPRVVGNWVWPCFSVVTGNFDVEILVGHGFATGGKMVDRVTFTATDESANSVSYNVSDMTVSAKSDQNGKVLCYKQTINVSTLTDGDLITVKAVAYPFVGDADSILNTDDAVNAIGSVTYTNQRYRLDKAVDHGFTVVDPTNGNDGTGAVYSSQVLAEAGNAYLTHASALTAMQSYHNSNSGHNDAGGGTFLLTEDTHEINTTNGGTMTEWAIFTPVSTASKANVIVNPPAGNGSIPSFFKVDGCTTNSTARFNGGNTNHIWFHDAEITALGTGATIAVYQILYSACTHSNVGSFNRDFKEFSTVNQAWAVLRGNTSTSGIKKCHGFVVVGNNGFYLNSNEQTGNPINDNFIFAFNYNDTADTTTQLSFESRNIVHGCLVLQNVLVRNGSQTEPLGVISADGSTNTTNNVLIFYNITPGGRFNAGYNDIATGGPYSQTNWFVKGNYFSDWNNKDDTFNDNASATGGWPVGYHVGHRYNYCASAAAPEWGGEFYGLDSIWYTGAGTYAGFVDDASADGSDLGDGDYNPAEGSDLIGLVEDYFIPYDLIGTARSSNGTVGAYTSLSGAIGAVANIYRRFLGGLQ